MVLYCHCLLKCTRLCANRRSLQIFSLAVSICAWNDRAQAEPVTFRFDATITNAPLGTPFDLPLTYEVGDIIHGEFTFDPGLAMPLSDNAAAADQPFELKFDINGTVIGTSSFRIEVFDDTAFDDSTFPEPIDVISFGCSEASCVPDLISLPGGDPFRVRSRMQLVGIDSILSNPEISPSPATWNSFMLERRLTLGFDDVGPGSMGLDALIGTVIQVPEPLSCGSFVLSVVVAFASFARRRRKTKESVYPNRYLVLLPRRAHR